MVKRASSSTENFNNDASIKVLGNWYEGNPLIRDRKFKSDRIFNNDIDDQLKGKKELSIHPIREQVQRMIHSGKTEGEIATALTKAIGNLPTEYANQSGSFANKNTRDDMSVVDMVLRNLKSQNPDVTGKSDKELNDAYKEFSMYLDQNLDKMFKDMPFENRTALVNHIKSDKSNADKIIKEQAMNLLKQQGSNYSASELLGELSGVDPSNQDVAIAGLYTISSDPNASAEDRNNYITNFDDSTASEQAELKVSGPPAATEDAGTSTGDSADPLSQTRTVYEQDRDGNWITGEKDWQGNWTSPPTIVGDDKALAAIARQDEQAQAALDRADSIYARDRADYEEDRGFLRRDAVTQRAQDLADIESMYGRQDETYARDRADTIADRKEDRGFQTADRDALWGREDTLIANANEA
jgi:hypothetical protein